MKTPENTIKDWQGWLADLKHSISSDGWQEFTNATDMSDEQLEQWASVYIIPIQSYLAKACMLVCLQSTAADGEAALNSLLKAVGELRFGKPARNLKRNLRDLYNESTRNVARMLPSIAELFGAVFSHYMRGDYDTQNDINLLMREAMTQSVARNRDAALALAGKAGAAALRGCTLWNGWADEGPDEFRQWALSLTTLLEGFASVLPLDDVAAERQRSTERATTLSKRLPRETAIEEEVLLSGAALDSLASEFTEILNRENPLSDEEIQQMGKRYHQYGELALRSLEMIDTIPDVNDMDDMMAMSVEALGVLRYTGQRSFQMLTDIIVNPDDEYEDELVSSATWALQQMGTAVIKPAMDFARYSSLVEPRVIMMRVLAVAGRGSEEIFDYLVAQFIETPWANNKSLYAGPLALTHDPRAIPLIIDALRNPAVTEDDAWTLLDALQELEVTFYINADNRSVDIPEHGVIEDVLPAGWRSRQELEDEAVEDEWDEEWDDENDDEDEDEDDDADIEEVVYDKEGIPRCPDCGAEMHFIAGRWVHTPPPIKKKK